MKIILASHGALAKGMKDTLDMIVGNQVSIQAYSAYDEENVDFASDISQQITREVNEQFIIVTDVMGGSVNNAMTELVLRYKNVFLITGMNLPFILSLVTYTKQINNDAINKLVTEGREGLINVNEMIKTIKDG
ncbi:PTS sugar transporter subunit IIA [Pediococcus acidilactici]|uniref:PTS sugar transporter subunit IIA n=1 Tax=Pediococcus acidilactici TaxID=1254 RepID=UPI00140F759B|nr:PTS fructose transporter subunit IIA [Pediococcus acidilactici]QIO84630.1 PTS fructose transporter subunit IIA [Pediococcus acidilactici]QJW86096.1 PTS fructose transporter subunit IIA [Pediococcus acidilactici]QYI94944.1 PTS fructose transporter subunit IIA [Pediococcus acidilactici]